MHRSPYHGFSIEFAEHREYVPGDDLRYVDWKVFGKTDKYYLKQYEEETNLVSYLLLDTSESMALSRATAAALSKLEYAQCLAAALAYLILQQQDSVGLVTFDQRDSGAGAAQQQSLASEAAAARDGASRAGAKNGRPAPIFHDLAERLKKRGHRADLQRLVRRRAARCWPG